MARKKTKASAATDDEYPEQMWPPVDRSKLRHDGEKTPTPDSKDTISHDDDDGCRNCELINDGDDGRHHDDSEKKAADAYIVPEHVQMQAKEILAEVSSDPNDIVQMLTTITTGKYTEREIEALLGYVDDETNMTPLYDAIEASGNIEAMAMLTTLAARLLRHPSTMQHGVGPLHRAVEKGVQGFVKVLIKAKADANAADDKGRTPLMIAAIKGKSHLPIVSLLISSGASVHLRDCRGWSALDFAVVSGSTLVTKALTDSGADPNASRGRNGKTPLYEATYRGHTEIVQHFVGKFGHDVKFTLGSNKPTTPLHVAAIYGNKAIVRLLLTAKADPSKLNGMGKTPLELAWEYGRMSCARLLRAAKGIANFNAITSDGVSCLHSAVMDRKPHMVKFLLQTDTEWSTTDLNESLITAVKNRDMKIASLLITIGHAGVTPSDYGESPLHSAIASGAIDIIKTLIGSGADLNARDEEGRVPMCMAASAGNADIIKLLLTGGAAVNVSDEKDETPLGIAISRGDVEMVTLLVLDGKADVNICHQSEGLINVAMQRLLKHRDRQKSIVNVLVANGAKVKKGGRGETPLGIAIACGDVEMVKLLIVEGKADVASTHVHTVVDNFATNPKSYVAICKTLLTHGADVNARGPMDQTQLEKAIACDNAEVVKLLIAFGADVNTRSSDGWMPLQLASTFVYRMVNGREVGAPRNPRTVRLLIAAGAKVNEAALRQAVTSSHIDALNIMLDEGAPVEVIYRMPYYPSGVVVEALKRRNILLTKPRSRWDFIGYF